MNKKKLFLIFLFAASVLLIVGFLKNDITMIYNFGRFICFDCIGLS